MLEVIRNIDDFGLNNQQFITRKASVGTVELHASASAVESGETDEFDATFYDKGIFVLDITAVSGTDDPTLDVKLQFWDGNDWVDLAEAFPQQTGIAEVVLKVPELYAARIRAVYTIDGTDPDFTFSLRGVVK